MTFKFTIFLKLENLSFIFCLSRLITDIKGIFILTSQEHIAFSVSALYPENTQSSSHTVKLFWINSFILSSKVTSVPLSDV